MIKIKQDLGMMFPTQTSKQKTRYVIVECQGCGKDYKTQLRNIKIRKRAVCKSCTSRNTGTKHKGVGTKLYKTWQGMKARIFNSNEKCFNNYGGRGISICEEWLQFKNFRDWALSNGYDELLTIDRINNDGNYEPSNCRWVTNKVQQRNKRILKSTNKSGYKGVCWFKNTNRWVVKICVDYKVIHLGYYNTPLEGAIAYNKYIDENNLEHTKNII